MMNMHCLTARKHEVEEICASGSSKIQTLSFSLKFYIYSNGKNLRLLKFVIKVGVANTHWVIYALVSFILYVCR